MDKIFLEKLESIELLLQEQKILQKDLLNLKETSNYLNLSTSQLYKLTSTNQITFYKPSGKKIYFKRNELDQWILDSRVSSASEIDIQAANYLMKKGKVV
jgi:excisionase family DNA binding protein